MDIAADLDKAALFATQADPTFETSPGDWSASTPAIAHVCMYVCMCVYICIYVYVYTRMYTYIYIYTYICISIALSLYIYIYMYKHIYIYTHTYIHIIHTWATLGVFMLGMRDVGDRLYSCHYFFVSFILFLVYFLYSNILVYVSILVH